MKTKEWHRVGCNKSIIPHNQPQRQVVGAWKAHLCFMLLPDSNFCVYLGPSPLGWTQSALPKPPWLAQLLCTCPQAPCNARTFLEVFPTRRPGGDQHLFFGEIPEMESLQFQHGHSNIFEQLRIEVVVPKLLQEICATWSKTVSGHPEEP